VDGGKVQRFLNHARIAGGDIQDHLYDPAGKAPHLFETFTEALKACKSGFGLIDRCELLEPENHLDQRDPLDRLLAATAWPMAQKEGATDKEEERPKWLTPIVKGYRTLTEPHIKEGSREAYPHAFAEPLVGLGQWAPIKKTPPDLWRYHRSTKDTFLFTTTNA
jgi:CRISPR-associated protein Csy2